LALFDSLDNRH